MKYIEDLIAYSSIFLILFGILNLFRKLYYPYYFFFTAFLIFSVSAISWSLAFDGRLKSGLTLSGLSVPFLFLIAPLSFIFTRHILSSKNSISRADFGHVLPTFVILLFSLSFYGNTGIPLILNPHPLTDDLKLDAAMGTRTAQISVWVMVSLSVIVYSYFQWQVIKAYRMEARPQHLKRKRGLLRWLEFNTICRGVVFTLFLGVILLSHTTGLLPLDMKFFSMVLFILPLMDFFIFVVDPQILVGMRYVQGEKSQEAFSFTSNPEVQVPMLASPKHNLPETREIPLADRIRKYLVDDQSFLLEGFNLKFMARALNVHPMAISKSILLESGLSFPDHISKLKLELLDDLIKNSPEFRQYSMDAMAKEVGFKSKNAFYLSFRKFRGISPSEYYKVYLKKP